ncbi:MAG: hypothetical protein KKC46_14830 [Proteobacteria bacterium]|nr:hypothetical protein [Pseudomonadota bacterium]
MKRIVGLILVFAVLIFTNTEFRADASADENFQKRILASSHAFMIARAGLQRAADFTRSRPDLFNQNNIKKSYLLTRQDKLAIWNTWSSVLDSLAALDTIRSKWKEFNLFPDKYRRNTSFTLNHATFLAGYRYALEFIELSDKNSSLNTILDEAVPELGIEAGSFGCFKLRFLNAAIATEFSALQIIGKKYAADSASPELRTIIEEDSNYIWKMGKGTGYILTIKNAVAIVQKATFVAWLPVQKNVSEWMGDTKVLRKGIHLISGEQIESMRKRLLPGDIIFERHEWYLSNMGLPGFWTHAALYVGTPEERRSFLSDPETIAWVKSEGVTNGDLEILLSQRYPNAYKISTTPQESGHAPCVLEAISEGVSFTSLEYSGAADSIVVLRPILMKPEKAAAILRAFHYSGRPYDFNFDFETDASLVCSELVYKAYEPGLGIKGIRFPISEIMGRKVSTPNEMVRQFDEQYGTKDAQTDFVLFLDGIEKEQRAVESTLEHFRISWHRPNWHILIQKMPEKTE